MRWRSSVPVLVFAGIVLTAFAVVTSPVPAAEPTPTAGRAAPPAVAVAPVEDPELAVDTQVCVVMSSIVEDAALAVEAQGRSPDSALASRLRVAETQMGEHLLDCCEGTRNGRAAVLVIGTD